MTTNQHFAITLLIFHVLSFTKILAWEAVHSSVASDSVNRPLAVSKSGRRVLQTTDYPAVVPIRIKQAHGSSSNSRLGCTGTVIGNKNGQCLLTARHCLIDIQEETPEDKFTFSVTEINDTYKDASTINLNQLKIASGLSSKADDMVIAKLHIPMPSFYDPSIFSKKLLPNIKLQEFNIAPDLAKTGWFIGVSPESSEADEDYNWEKPRRRASVKILGNDFEDQYPGVSGLSSMFKEAIFIDSFPSSPFPGDSGGPVFINVNGKEELYGIVNNDKVLAPIVPHRKWLLNALEELGCGGDSR